MRKLFYASFLMIFLLSACAGNTTPTATTAPSTQIPATQMFVTQVPASQAPLTQAPATAQPVVTNPPGCTRTLHPSLLMSPCQITPTSITAMSFTKCGG